MTISGEVIDTQLTMGDLQRICKYFREGYCMTGYNQGGACEKATCPTIRKREIKPFAKCPKSTKNNFCG